jgi:membrane protein
MNVLTNLAAVVRGFDRYQQRHAWLAFPVAVLRKYDDDQAGSLAALLAYYAFIAIFPFLLILVTVLGWLLRDDPELQQRVLDSAVIDFPVIGAQLQENVTSLDRTGAGLVIGFAIALLGLRGVAHTAQDALNKLWGVPRVHRPGFPMNIVRSMGLILLLGLGVLGTAALSGVGGGGGALGTGSRIIAYAASFVLTVGLVVVMFRIATSGAVPTRRILPMAIATGLVYQVFLAVGTILVRVYLSHASSVYGVFGIVLGLITWLYVQASVTLHLIEADIVRVKHLWPRALTQPPITEGDERAYRSYVEAEVRRPEQDVDVTFNGAETGARATEAASDATSTPRPRS